jgi:hypothetical protein
MNDVQLQFAHQRISECARVAPRGLDTNKNFAVLEREHVSRTQLSEKLPMQKRHPPIGNKPHEKFARFAQVASFPLSQVQTMPEGIRCESFELCNIHRIFSLNIPHADARGFCAYIHLFRDLFLLARPNQNRAIVSLDIRIVKARLRFRRHQVAINRGRHIAIAIDRAVYEFDFENVTTFTVPNFCDRGRFNRLPQYARNDVIRCR